jgi:hypothetical protein
MSLLDNSRAGTQLELYLCLAGKSYFTSMVHDHQVFVGLDHPYGAFAAWHADQFSISAICLRIQGDI